MADEPPSKDSATAITRRRTNVLRAVHDYKSEIEDDMSSLRGDLLELVDDEDPYWWLVKNLETNKEGYIPSSFVVTDDDSPETQEWWIDADRIHSEKLLLLPGQPIGTFLVRGSSDTESYALSVRDGNEEQGKVNSYVKHYKIRKNTNGTWCIHQEQTFSSFLELIENYKASADGLCCKLTNVCRKEPEPICRKEPEPISFKDLEVERASVKLGHQLGAGSFGKVYAAKLGNIEDVAVKIMLPGTMTTDAFLEEAKMMHHLRHNNLVQLKGVCTTESPIYIITELMAKGSLLDYLRRDNGRTIKLPALLDMAAQITDGMAYLETKNYTHRDLRTANILVSHSNIVKVADFGLARLTDDQEVYLAREGAKYPVKWTAPEALRKQIFSIKSDVWSFGILLHEIVTFGELPYPEINNRDVLNEIDKGYRMPNPQGRKGIECPDYMYEIMLMCWKLEPEERPTFKYLHDKFVKTFVITKM